MAVFRQPSFKDLIFLNIFGGIYTTFTQKTAKKT
jgi:hypothetical protein